MVDGFYIRSAQSKDVPLILSFIGELAEYERLSHEVVATEDSLRKTLFGENPSAEVLLGFAGEQPVCFSLFFTNYSTFLGKPGMYLEDLFVKPEARGFGYGKGMLTHLARICVERDYGRFEWSVLDWNEPAIGFYEKLGAKPMDEWTVYRVTGDALTELAATEG